MILRAFVDAFPHANKSQPTPQWAPIKFQLPPQWLMRKAAGEGGGGPGPVQGTEKVSGTTFV